MNSSGIRIGAALLVGIGCGLAAGLQRRRACSLRGRVVVITGGSRGLGVVLARQLAEEGAKLALLARDPVELSRAQEELKHAGADAIGIACDLRKQAEVERAMHQVATTFGAIDVLINNAGIIQVGPLDHMRVEDFDEALAIHLYAPLFCTLAVLPHMRRQGGGRIVNITSVGGKISVPHLVPYCASKFALVGLSDGLRAELRRENILVTTVCPGLMRTGSPRNAFFKGQHKREYAWFAISDSMPLLSVSAEYAAKQIIRACRLGKARLIIGVHTKAAVIASELFPGVFAGLAALGNSVLPGPGKNGPEMYAGHQSKSMWAPSWLTRLSEQAALRNNEVQ